MEKEDNITNSTNSASNSRIWTGLVLLVIGGVFFMKNFGVEIPAWLISWHMGVLLIGLLVGFKRRFEGIGWIIMVIVGGGFTVSAITEQDFSEYYIASIFIVFGLFLIFKPKSTKSCKNRFKNPGRFKRDYHSRDFNDQGAATYAPQVGSFNTDNQTGTSDTVTQGFVYNDKEDHDILDCVNVFGGSTQTVFSKNFKGGDIVAVFGGCDVNLTQADFTGTIVVEVVAVFGGAKIVVPQSWEVKSEVTAIFGGLDDKRGLAPIAAENRKVIIIRGLALFGGVEIKNF